MFQVQFSHCTCWPADLSPRIKFEKSCEVKFAPGCREDFVLVDNRRDDGDDGDENVTQIVNSRYLKLHCPSLCQMLATFSGVEF